jgi:hypothetical protein
LFFTELCVSATFCVSFHAGSSLPGQYSAINRGDTQDTLTKALYTVRANAEEEEEVFYIASDKRTIVVNTSRQRKKNNKHVCLLSLILNQYLFFGSGCYLDQYDFYL